MHKNTHKSAPSLAPNPDGTGGVAGFAASLRALKIHVGNPSLNELAKRSGIPRSTLADALNPGRSGVPRLTVVMAFVDACGVTHQEALAWRQAWQAVQTAQDQQRVNSVERARDRGAWHGGSWRPDAV